MINSSVNRKTARKRFSTDDRVQIHNFLSDDVLQQVLGELDQAPFNLVYVLDDKIQTTSREKMDSMGQGHCRLDLPLLCMLSLVLVLPLSLGCADVD